MRVLLVGSFAALLILSFFIGLTTASAANDSYLVRVPAKGKALVKSLRAHDIEILAFSKDGLFDVLANEKQLAWLYTLGVPVSVVQTPGMSRAASELDANLGLYSTYAEMQTTLT